MKSNKIYQHLTVAMMLALFACNEPAKDAHQHDAHGNHLPVTVETESENHSDHDDHEDHIKLTTEQIDALNIKIEPIRERELGGFIQVNGILGVPPQNEAIVTSVLGANINSIKAIEGDEVRKGQILAFITHPDIITMQTDFLEAYNRLNFLKLDYDRQKKLYEAKVGSGRDYQKAKSSFSSAQGLVKGYESQLSLLGLSSENVKSGNIVQLAPIISPINGFIEKVLIKSGQYVQAHTPMFEVVNTDHIHVDLMVFERDVTKVKNGQKVQFRIEALGNEEMEATIYAVGKSFEENPKALHIHAEIENKDKNLIPGMYVNARIITEGKLEKTLSEDAVFQEGEIYYVFVAEKENDQIWEFQPREIVVKETGDGIMAIDFIDELDENILVAQSGAYYLMAEMKKGEAEHSH